MPLLHINSKRSQPLKENQLLRQLVSLYPLYSPQFLKIIALPTLSAIL